MLAIKIAKKMLTEIIKGANKHCEKILTLFVIKKTQCYGENIESHSLIFCWQEQKRNKIFGERFEKIYPRLKYTYSLTQQSPSGKMFFRLGHT